MTRQQELKCPKCGARIYVTDSHCFSCGVRLDEGQLVDERRPEPEPVPVPVPVPPPPEAHYEEKEWPSGWPVYLAAAVIGLGGPVLATVLFFHPRKLNDLLDIAITAVLVGVPGLFSIVTAYGLVRLRSWGWVCAVIWLGYFAYFGLNLLLALVIGFPMATPVTPRSAEAIRDAERMLKVAGPVWLITVVLLAWALLTRRQLFFPAEQEGGK